jgi:2-dehydropantoate 2-reductase
LAREARAIAGWEGVVIDRDPDEIVQTVVRASATNRSSMLQDVDAGRPTEIDALVGALVRRADALGRGVPALAAAFAAIRDGASRA